MTDDSPTTAVGDRFVEPAPGASAAPRSARRRWPLFVGLAVAIVVVDQLAKALVTRSLAPGQSVDVVGDLVRIVFGQNTGALFGMFKDNAAMFGVVSLVVVGLIVAYHARSAASLYLTVTLGFLLGGAIGNMLDRLRLGFVVDFVDVGIGPTRFYTFNVADSAISLAILLLFIAAVRPSLVDGGARTSESPPPAAPTSTDEDWGDGLEPADRSPDEPAR
ncbi:MAG TPA: signal peptidase II [Candidatus Limnocylindrales bacterium]|nr:signal peptidase II [Candidatus Limnocylindrales bacterium]